MQILTVMIHVKPEHLEAFKAATLENARSSVREPGIARFDVLKDPTDATHFVLVEVYRHGDAPAEHKQTPHYQRWRDAVEPMMAEPRRSEKYASVFPEDAAW